MDYVYIHRIVDTMLDRVHDIFDFIPFIILMIFPVVLYKSIKKSSHEQENKLQSKSVVNSKIEKVAYGILIGFGLAVIVLLIAKSLLVAHDQKVRIENTKTWMHVQAKILDASTEHKSTGGRNGGSEHCYHIHVGYDFNQVHYTSEIEFLDQCKVDLLVGLDYTAVARHYYPPSYSIQVLVDPKNPQHIRDMSYISNSNNYY